MGKTTGGIRNYRPNSSAYKKRKAEFERLMATGDYIREASHFYSGGGFVVTHKEHNPAQRKKGKLVDKSYEAAMKLARKGFRVFLDSERNNRMNSPISDGRIEKMQMDIKTIGKAGKHTIKSSIEDASKQDARVVVLMQGTKKMTRQYVANQVHMFEDKSPKRARVKIDYVIVVGKSGNVHRYKIEKKIE